MSTMGGESCHYWDPKQDGKSSVIIRLDALNPTCTRQLQRTIQFRSQFVGCLLGHMVTAVEAASADIGRPGAPDAKNVAVQLLEIISS